MSKPKPTPRPWAAIAVELSEFVQRIFDETLCVCKFNRIGGTNVWCTRCAAEKLLAKARGESA
jgi:hypothetical protein